MNVPPHLSDPAGAAPGASSPAAGADAAPAAGAAPAGAGALRLEVADLQIRLAGSAADVVDEVSFSVASGEVLGLVGESGSGKTTVALALLGHARRGLAITRGQVRLDGTDLLRLRPEEIRAVRGSKVAYVPQDPASALNPTLRVGTLVKEALRVHAGVAGDITARAAEVLAEVRLDATPDLLRRYPHQLSGGQQQRVALAMAFSCRPALIVLDEPTTGLDVTTQRHVLETVRSLCRSYGVAAVYVSHDLAVVAGLASDVAVMYAGRIIELGQTAGVFGHPLHPYTRGLLAAVPSPDRAEVLAGIEGQPPRPGRRPPGCSFAPRCSFATAACLPEPPQPQLLAGRVVRCIRAADVHAVTTARAPVISPAVTTTAPVLSVHALRAYYGTTPALADVDLQLSPESCLAVVGESGSGKTTLARCIVGLHKNWDGQITFDGSPLATWARKRPKTTLKRIQYVFQNPYTSLNPRKTIGQILAEQLDQFTSLSFTDRSDRVTAVLRDVSLGPDFATRFPDQLSGGERQRAAIARALIVEPDLLVCDEVTSALDVSVQAVIVELLRQLQHERRLAMIFITHNLALVRSIAQTVAVLSSGTLIETGPTADIIEHPKNPYTIHLMEDVPKLTTTPAGTDAVHPAGHNATAASGPVPEVRTDFR